MCALPGAPPPGTLDTNLSLFYCQVQQWKNLKIKAILNPRVDLEVTIVTWKSHSFYLSKDRNSCYFTTAILYNTYLLNRDLSI